MKLLAIDTATQACSVALLVGDTLIARYEEPGRGHSELILPMVDAVLKEGALQLEALDCIAVGRGPGAFTGVRIAISVAQGLAFGAGLRIVPVSDLAAVAQRVAHAPDTKRVVACMDARMGEVYWARFDVSADGLVRADSPEQLSRPQDVHVDGSRGWVAAGTRLGSVSGDDRTSECGGEPTPDHSWEPIATRRGDRAPRRRGVAGRSGGGARGGLACVPA